MPRYSGLGLYSLALPNKITAAGNDSAKQEEAMAKAQHAYNFIEFYATSLEYQLMYCNSTLLMPSLKAGEGQGEFKGDYWTKAYEQLRTSKFRPALRTGIPSRLTFVRPSMRRSTIGSPAGGPESCCYPG